MTKTLSLILILTTTLLWAVGCDTKVTKTSTTSGIVPNTGDTATTPAPTGDGPDAKLAAFFDAINAMEFEKAIEMGIPATDTNGEPDNRGIEQLRTAITTRSEAERILNGGAPGADLVYERVTQTISNLYGKATVNAPQIEGDLAIVPVELTLADGGTKTVEFILERTEGTWKVVVPPAVTTPASLGSGE